jgi:hypothetical protein
MSFAALRARSGRVGTVAAIAIAVSMISACNRTAATAPDGGAPTSTRAIASPPLPGLVATIDGRSLPFVSAYACAPAPHALRVVLATTPWSCAEACPNERTLPRGADVVDVQLVEALLPEGTRWRIDRLEIPAVGFVGHLAIPRDGGGMDFGDPGTVEVAAADPARAVELDLRVDAPLTSASATRVTLAGHVRADGCASARAPAASLPLPVHLRIAGRDVPVRGAAVTREPSGRTNVALLAEPVGCSRVTSVLFELSRDDQGRVVSAFLRGSMFPTQLGNYYLNGGEPPFSMRGDDELTLAGTDTIHGGYLVSVDGIVRPERCPFR